MATKNRPTSKTLSDQTAKADQSEASATPPLIQAAETVTVLDPGIQASPPPLEGVESAAVASAATPIAESPPPAVARVLDAPRRYPAFSSRLI